MPGADDHPAVVALQLDGAFISRSSRSPADANVPHSRPSSPPFVSQARRSRPRRPCTVTPSASCRRRRPEHGRATHGRSLFRTTGPGRSATGPGGSRRPPRNRRRTRRPPLRRRRGPPRAPRLAGSSGTTSPAVPGSRELGRELGRRVGGDQQLVHPQQPLALARVESLADQLVEVGRALAHVSSSSSASQGARAPPRPRLHRAERQVQILRDLALGQPALVGELDHRALVLGQGLERPMDAPRDP